MKRRALGAAFVAALISALTGSLAWADNPHGTPPGQAKQSPASAGASVSASASTSAENRGQAKKADEASAQANAQSNTSASAAAGATTKQTPGGDKFNGCTGTPNTSGSAGVKPSSDTDKWTCANAGATPDQTKRYGNGSTAGQGVVARGGAGATLRGPGNSQPHMVQPCPGSRHWRDWHAVKSFGTSSCAQAKPPATPAVTPPATTTSVTTMTPTSVTNNAVTNNSATNSSSVSNAPGSGVKAAQKSSTPSAPAQSTAPAATTSPAASTAPATTKGVLGTTASPSGGTLPFTGLPLWLPALLAAGLAVTGYGLVRYGRSRA